MNETEAEGSWNEDNSCVDEQWKSGMWVTGRLREERCLRRNEQEWSEEEEEEVEDSCSCLFEREINGLSWSSAGM